MNKPRKLAAVLLVATAMTLSVATTAHAADIGDAIDDWTWYLCYYFEVC